MSYIVGFVAGVFASAITAVVFFIWVNRKHPDKLDSAEGKVREFDGL